MTFRHRAHVITSYPRRVHMLATWSGEPPAYRFQCGWGTTSSIVFIEPEQVALPVCKLCERVADAKGLR